MCTAKSLHLIVDCSDSSSDLVWASPLQLKLVLLHREDKHFVSHLQWLHLHLFIIPLLLSLLTRVDISLRCSHISTKCVISVVFPGSSSVNTSLNTSRQNLLRKIIKHNILSAHFHILARCSFWFSSPASHAHSWEYAHRPYTQTL